MCLPRKSVESMSNALGTHLPAGIRRFVVGAGGKNLHKFSKVEATCQDGSGGAISGSDPRHFAISGKNFTRKTRVLGTGIKHGYFKATGKFRRGGKAVKGTVRFAFKTTSGVGCGTGKVPWRAEA